MSELYERSWTPARAKAAVVIKHGLAEHSGRYDYVAQALNRAGYAVFAEDVRGHGQSVGFPGDMGGDPKLVVDDLVVQLVRAQRDFPKTFLLGHSMGTLISLPAAIDVPVGTLSGLILSGLATVPAAEVLERLGKQDGGPTLPPEWVSRSPEIVQAYIDDPLVFSEVPEAALGVLIGLGPLAADAVPKVEVPVLMLHGSADKLCDVQGAHQAYAEMIVSDKTVKVYDGLYHEVLNDPERDQVIADLVAWLDAH